MSDHEWPWWLERPPTADALVTDDGEPMESERHRLQMSLLLESLNLAWADRRDFYAGGNMFLYYSILQTKQPPPKRLFRGPDVFVVLDVERRERKAWVVWEEDGRVPDVIIELTSPSTEEIDRVEKVRVYGRLLKVPEYFIYDPFSHALTGFALDGETLTYRPIAPAGGGRLPSKPLGLELGVAPGRYEGVECSWLRWFRPDGRLLPTAEEARDEAARQRDEAARQRDEALARLAEYERRFGRLPEPR